MRDLRAFLIPAAVLAVALFAIPSGGGQQHSVVQGHDQTTPHDHLQGDQVHTTVSHPHDIVPCTYPEAGHAAIHHDANTHGDHEHLALSDMQHYAVHHLSDFSPLTNTYGSAPQWAREWELRWIDYDTGQGIVRVYHATNRHDDDVRYTSLWDGTNLRYHAWEPVH